MTNPTPTSDHGKSVAEQLAEQFGFIALPRMNDADVNPKFIAAIDAALERAAQACEKEAAWHKNGIRIWDQACLKSYTNMAARIRALTSKGTTV